LKLKNKKKLQKKNRLRPAEKAITKAQKVLIYKIKNNNGSSNSQVD
jgi:hypothetical protein